MNNRINTPSALWFAPLSEIQSLQTSPSGTIKVSVTSWRSVPFVKGSVAYEVDKGTGKAGSLFETRLSARLNQPLEFSHCIVRLDFESGDSYILGDKDLPVVFDQLNQLMQKSISATHQSWHSPYLLIP